MKFENRTFAPIKDWRFDDWQGYDDNFSLYVVVIAMLRMYSCGERKSENMDQEMKKIQVKVADYAENEKKVLTKRMGAMTAGTLVLFSVFSWGAVQNSECTRHYDLCRWHGLHFDGDIDLKVEI